MALVSGSALGKAGSVLAVAALAAGSAIVLSGPPAKVFAIGPHAWFDEPLDGTYLEEGPVHVVAHAADPDGVVEVVLSVGGEVAETIDAGGEQLVDIELDWEPPGDGTFELTVVGIDNAEHETVPDAVTVHIGEDPSELAIEDVLATTTTLPADTATSADSTSSTEGSSTSEGQTTTTGGVTTTRPGASTTQPATTTTGPGTTTTRPATTTTGPTTTTTRPTTTTTAACPGRTTNASPANGATVGGPNPILTWGYTGCVVAGFVVQVSLSSGFERLKQDEFVPWPARSASAALGCPGDASTWWWRVKATGDADGPWSSPTSFTMVCR